MNAQPVTAVEFRLSTVFCTSVLKISALVNRTLDAALQRVTCDRLECTWESTVGATKKARSKTSAPTTQAPRIPAEVTDTALISARLVQQIHRSLLMCHLLEERVASSTRKGVVSRVRRGDGAMVVGATIGLNLRDIVITLGDTLLPHVTRGTPLAELILHLSQQPPAPSAVARQLEVARAAVVSAAAEARVVLLLCTDRNHGAGAMLLAEQCTADRLPLVVLLKCSEIPPENRTPVIPVEAHDAIALYRVTQEALWRARRKAGPTIIAALHSSPHVSATEHFESEALVRLREYMQRHEVWDESLTERLRRELQIELDKAFAGTKVSS